MPPPPPPPPEKNRLPDNEDGVGGAPASTPAKKPWSKPIVMIIAENGALLTKGGSQAGTTENAGYFFQS